MRHIVVPKKWLYAFQSNDEENSDYILICEEISILPGGYWPGPTNDCYKKMSHSIMVELCLVLYNVCGCDAWPQNQPFTIDNQIAFIDTESLGKSHGDFLRLMVFINPKLHYDAIMLWKSLKAKRPWILENRLF